MKFLLSLLLIGNLLTGSILAQSGRRIGTPTRPSGDTATPVTVPPITEPVNGNRPAQVGYSESRPNPRRLGSGQPNLRSAPTTRTNDSKSEQKPVVLSDSEDDVLRVETNLVTIPVSVFDRNGLYIADLQKPNFKIFEDGVEQPIEFFATTENPVTVALLIDTSPSTAFKIEEIQAAAIAFVKQLKPQDSVIVAEFDGDVQFLTERTTDREKIFNGIRRADFGNGTALYDAVDTTLRRRLAKVEGRKAIVLFTDGVDTVSRASYDRTVSLAEESDVIIFPIYYNTFNDTNRGGGGVFSPFPPMGGGMRGISRQEYVLGRAYLNDLANGTGGRVFNAENTPGGLIRTFESLAEELRRQYQVGYIPANPGKAGQRKAIKIRIDRPNLVIRARDSYIVGETGP